MQKIIALLQIKSYNFADFTMWLNWYTNFIKCNEIYICDDNSKYNLKNIINLINPNVKYYKRNELKFENFPTIDNNNQIKIYNCLLDIAKPNKDDIIIIPDEDEFWWYDTQKYKSFIDCANIFRNKLLTDAILVPWTLMRSKEIINKRNLKDCFCHCFNYRSNIENCEHKPILFYNGFINTNHHCGYKNSKSITESKENSIFSKCNYNLPLRCYHYRFTTAEEFKLKMKCSVNNHKKRDNFNLNINFIDIEQNKNYNILDKTISDIYKKYETV